jgi:RNA polymerase sigma-70 factor (subfamily 1)
MSAPAAGDPEPRQVAPSSAPAAASVETLLMRHLPRLRVFVRLRVDAALRQRESSSDLVQSVCREVLEHAGTFTYDGEERFRAWLFTAALNKIRERKRSLATDKRDVDREVVLDGSRELADARMALQSPSEFAVAGELAQHMELAFDQLSEDHREVITLARVVGLSHAEIAQHMHRGEGAVRMLLSRALVAYVAAMDRVRGQR